MRDEVFWQLADCAHLASEENKAFVFELSDQLARLDTIGDAFRYGRKLLEFAIGKITVQVEPGKPPHLLSPSEIFMYKSWTFPGAREAIFAVFGMKDVIGDLTSLLRRSAFLRQHTDHETLAQAAEAFEKSFPAIDDVRDAAAHPFDRIVSRDDFNANRVAATDEVAKFGAVQGFSRIALNAFMDNQTFRATVRKKAVACEITEAKEAELRDISRVLAKAFEPVVAALNPQS